MTKVVNMTKVSKYLVGLSRGRRMAVFGATAAMVLSTVSVTAIPITGEIHFGGGFIPVDSGFSATALGSATGIDFINPGVVTVGTGDFASLTPYSTPATFTDFQFSPLSPSPVDPLWTAGGFSFKLTGVVVTMQSATQLTLLGTGFVSGVGFDATPGNWNFTGNASSTMFTFSANSEAARVSVPDGGNTLLLLGAAFLGIGLAASRFSRAKARVC